MMDTKILEIAQRIKGLREILEISVDEMASATDTSAAEYQRLRAGSRIFRLPFYISARRDSALISSSC